MSDDEKAQSTLVVQVDMDRWLNSRWRLAKAIVEGGMAPRGIKHPGAVIAILQAGRELGIPEMQALASLTFISGRLGLMGKASMARVISKEVLEPGTRIGIRYDGAEDSPERSCTVSARRKGWDTPVEESFSLAKAIRMGLVRIAPKGVEGRARDGWSADTPWARDPDRQLMWRAWGRLADVHFADVLLGVGVAEVLRDEPRELVELEVPATAAALDPLLAGAPSLDIPVLAPSLQAAPTTPPAQEPPPEEPASLYAYEPPGTPAAKAPPAPNRLAPDSVQLCACGHGPSLHVEKDWQLRCAAAGCSCTDWTNPQQETLAL